MWYALALDVHRFYEGQRRNGRWRLVEPVPIATEPMSAKEVRFFRFELANKCLAGIDILANAVKVTLGPKGRNVVLAKSYGSPAVTKDGVSVAKEIELADKFENMGAQMVKEVASQTSDIVGSGTTTATVLAQIIAREGVKSLAAGMNPMDLKAVEEGIVPGGGVALVRAIEAIDKIKGDNHDQDVGIAIARRALEEPLRQIVANAGEESSVVVAKVRNGKG